MVRGAVRRAASDEEDECEKAFEMAEDGGMGGTDGGEVQNQVRRWMLLVSGR